MLKKLKKNKIFLTAIMVTIIGSFLVGNIVSAQTGIDSVDCGINFICHFGKILLYIVQFEGYVAGLLMTLFTTIIKVSKFTDAAAVQLGWTLVRDLSNMFFVLIILAIAIGTILRIESYNLKKALPRVVIMAVAVNFSLLIFGLITDFAQVIMTSFIVIIQDGLNNDVLIQAFGLPDLTVAGDKINQTTGKDILSSGDVIVTLIFAIIMMVIAIMVIFVMLIVILLRTIMLWLLAVLSPLPYVFSAFPQGKKYAAMWWSEFAKYLIIGPAFAFFLWLALSVVAVKDQSKIFGDQIDDIGSVGEVDEQITSAGVFSEGSQPPNVLNFIIAIGMLLGGLVLTQRAGVAGAGLAGNVYGRVRSAGLKTATLPLKGIQEIGGLISRGAAKRSARGGLNRVFSLASPKTITEGFKSARAQSEREAYPEAVSGIQDIVNRANPLYRFQRKTQFQRIARRTDVKKYASEIEAANLSEVELGQELDNELALGKKANPARVEALLLRQRVNRQEDDHEVTVRDEEYSPEKEVARYNRVKKVLGKERADEIFGSLTDATEGNQRLRGLGLFTQEFENGQVVRILNDTPDKYEKELEVRIKRGELQRILPNLEGKAFRRIRRAGYSTIDALRGRKVTRSFGDYDSFGVATFRALPRKLGDVIDRRGHSMAERVKESIGFQEGLDENGRPNGSVELTSAGALVDSFRLNKEVAGSILSNIKLDDQNMAMVHKILTSKGAKDAGVDQGFIKKLFEAKGQMGDAAQGKFDNKLTSDQKNLAQGLNTGKFEFERVEVSADILNKIKDPVDRQAIADSYHSHRLVERPSQTSDSQPPPIPPEQPAQQPQPPAAPGVDPYGGREGDITPEEQEILDTHVPPIMGATDDLQSTSDEVMKSAGDKGLSKEDVDKLSQSLNSLTAKIDSFAGDANGYSEASGREVNLSVVNNINEEANDILSGLSQSPPADADSVRALDKRIRELIKKIRSR